jgi:hypothetical protein
MRRIFLRSTHLTGADELPGGSGRDVPMTGEDDFHGAYSNAAHEAGGSPAAHGTGEEEAE